MRDMQVISRKNREYLDRKNPCLMEEDLSRQCLEKNDYDKTKCERYFKNLIQCREFWIDVRRERRMKGIRPELPYPEERAQIKAEYLKKKAEKFQ